MCGEGGGAWERGREEREKHSSAGNIMCKDPEAGNRLPRSAGWISGPLIPGFIQRVSLLGTSCETHTPRASLRDRDVRRVALGSTSCQRRAECQTHRAAGLWCRNADAAQLCPSCSLTPRSWWVVSGGDRSDDGSGHVLGWLGHSYAICECSRLNTPSLTWTSAFLGLFLEFLSSVHSPSDSCVQLNT